MRKLEEPQLVAHASHDVLPMSLHGDSAALVK